MLLNGKGKMKAATMKSMRLNRMFAFLSDHNPHDADYIVENTKDRNFTTTISELRTHGYGIKYNRENKTWRLLPCKK
jgi:hypothetical protein